MPATRKYFQDKIVLSLVSLNIFLAVLVIIVVALRLGSSSGESYIVQDRVISGTDFDKAGGSLNFIYIIIFAAVATVFNVFMSFKTYRLRRQLAVTVLSMGALLLLIAFIVSNALLGLR